MNTTLINMMQKTDTLSYSDILVFCTSVVGATVDYISLYIHCIADDYSSGYLVLSYLVLASVLLLRPISPELVLIRIFEF